MLHNLLTSVVIILSALPSVLSVCPAGDIGIANFFASSGGEGSDIVANDCSIIDTRGTLDGNICGSYVNGGSVQCNAGTQIPNTAQTGDGTNWGPCFATTGEFCGAGNPVLFCCQPA